MEITTLVGIAIAVVIMAFGLKLIFKKPRDTAPSLESELQFNEGCQKPIIPRHVRDQLQVADSEEKVRVEPTLDTQQVQAEFEFDKDEPKLNEDLAQASESASPVHYNNRLHCPIIPDDTSEAFSMHRKNSFRLFP